jgi:hypothetical protein
MNSLPAKNSLLSAAGAANAFTGLILFLKKQALFPMEYESILNIKTFRTGRTFICYGGLISISENKKLAKGKWQ